MLSRAKRSCLAATLDGLDRPRFDGSRSPTDLVLLGATREDPGEQPRPNQPASEPAIVTGGALTSRRKTETLNAGTGRVWSSTRASRSIASLERSGESKRE